MKRNKRGTLAYRDEFAVGRMGIRSRMLIDLSMLVAFIISLIWVCQIALLFSCYRTERENRVNRTSELIIRNIDHEDLSALAERVCAESDVCLLLLGPEGEERLSVDSLRHCLLHHMAAEKIRALAAKAPEDGKGYIEVADNLPFRNDHYEKDDFEGPAPENDGNRSLSLLYARQVEFGDGSRGTLLLNTQITPTNTLVAMMQKQFLVILAATLLGTAVLGFIISGGLTRPLIATNEAAKKLSVGEYTRPAYSGGYREIAELNDTLVQAAADLRRVDDLQKELIANISHDLRTPLTMIQGYAETMRDIPGEMNPENMQVIIDETNRLSSMVNEVLDFSRLRTGSLQLEMTDFDLTETVGAIRDRIAAMVSADGYVIECDRQDPIRVRADRKRIEQVVYNLLGNALTYTGEDKTVRISAGIAGQHVRVRISDSGKGIDPADLPYIWDRYYRSRESHKRAVIGSGLGLNICRGILENHHAPYGVDSTPGEGTTFWFELPLAEEQA